MIITKIIPSCGLYDSDWDLQQILQSVKVVGLLFISRMHYTALRCKRMITQNNTYFQMHT